jgi:hypothetical protein
MSERPEGRESERGPERPAAQQQERGTMSERPEGPLRSSKSGEQ